MKRETIKTFYDHWAEQEISKNYDLREMTIKWKAKVFEKLIQQNYHFKNLLDIGCAEGILADELSKFLNVDLAIGIEICTSFIQFGKERYQTIQFVQNDGWLPFKDKSFDLTICSDFIEHVSQIQTYLDEIQRVSKFILFKIPIESCRTGNFFRAIGLYPKIGKDHPSGHLHRFSVKSALEMIKRNRFSIINFSFEITPQTILYYGVPKVRIYLNPITYLEKISRKFFPRWYLPLMGGNLFAFCKV